MENTEQSTVQQQHISQIGVVICLIVALFLAGCSSNPPIPAAPWVGKYGNACLPEAVAMTAGLQAHGVQAKVLRVQTARWSHAVCVYLYPPGQNRLWVWDSYWKSVNVRAWYADPSSVAWAWLNSTSGERLAVAEYME